MQKKTGRITSYKYVCCNERVHQERQKRFFDAQSST